MTRPGFRIIGFVSFLLLAQLPGLKAEESMTSSSNWSLSADYLEYLSSGNVVHAMGHVALQSTSTGTAVRIEANDLQMYSKEEVAIASGNVHIQDGPLSLWGQTATFDWKNSTGHITNAYLENPPWRIWGKRIDKRGPDQYWIDRGAATNCDVNPPHYHFRGRYIKYVSKKRATLYRSALALEKEPVLYTPIWTRSLKDRRYSLRIHPGRTSRNGYIANTIWGYPTTTHSYLRAYWDHYQKSGNGYGAEFNYFTPTANGSLYGYEVKDRISKTKRWTTRLGHSQQFSHGWSARANAYMQSDSDFSNQYFRNDIERVRQNLESDAGISYQHAYYTSSLSTKHKAVYDPFRRKFVRYQTVAPELSFQTAPIELWHSSAPIYAQFATSYKNEYNRPQSEPYDVNPLNPNKDLYRQTVNSSLSFSETIPLCKSITLGPSLGLSEEWSSWQDAGTTIDQTSIYRGRGYTTMNLRHRVTRWLDYDLAHNYKVRWRQNSFARDVLSSDRGLETNNMSLFTSLRPGSSFWLRASSGYELRRLRTQTVKSPRQLITPPVAEMSYRPTRWMDIFYRETYSLYPDRRPQSTQMSLQIGRAEQPNFSTGYSYTGTRGQVQIRHAAEFPLTPGWWLDGGFQYNATGPYGLHYDTVQIIEKFITIRRDLHCWQLRVEMTERLDAREIFFRLDLKKDYEDRKKLYEDSDEQQYYPGRKKSNL
ncbi:MAG TPA: hypothetical protein PK876_09105 [Elusimicrobiota bacterium]|nr:hypothetical protein [Elusimicrobiota bacterium]